MFGRKSAEDFSVGMPVCCITLEEEPWKRIAAEKEFEASGVEVEWIPGFFGASLGLKAMMPAELHPDGTEKFVHVNQLAHTLTYLAVLRFAVVREYAEFLIIEDDVSFTPGFSRCWKTFADSFRNHADVVQLEYCGSEDKIVEPVDSNISRCYYPFGAAAVWWTFGAAKTALMQMRTICEPTDVALIRRVYPFVRHGISTPPLCSQKSSKGKWPSSIGIAHKPV